MLYEQWLTVVRSNSGRLALWDGASGRQWTFGELAVAVERLSKGDGPITVVNGTGSDFVLGVLQAWRDGKVLLPLERGQTAPQISVLPPRDIVHLKTTSATTSMARLITFTAEQLVADCENVVKTMGLGQDVPNVGAVSLAHSYGFSNLILPLLLKGIPLFLAESALPESVRAAIEQAPLVAVPSVPALWRTWHDAGILSARIRIAISAGAPLPLSLEEQVFKSTGVKLHNFYGSSECGGIAYDRTSEPRKDASLAGTPMDGVQVGLNDNGCVNVRSCAVGTGYWPEPEAELNEGVFRSGDLAEIVDGAVYLRGRACDRINVAGRKVIPEEVERKLVQHPAVKDCLVFGVPADSLRNEKIVACVAANSTVSSGDLTDFLQSRLPGWQVPREWWILDTLDVNERGKRSRSDWRERFLRKQASAE